MWTLGIEPGEPLKKLQVELGQIVEQQRFVYVEELFLHGAVEALAVRVHLGGSREGVPVHNALSSQGAVEVFAELVAVIREHSAYGGGEECVV